MIEEGIKWTGAGTFVVGIEVFLHCSSFIEGCASGVLTLSLFLSPTRGSS